MARICLLPSSCILPAAVGGCNLLNTRMLLTANLDLFATGEVSSTCWLGMIINLRFACVSVALTQRGWTTFWFSCLTCHLIQLCSVGWNALAFYSLVLGNILKRITLGRGLPLYGDSDTHKQPSSINMPNLNLIVPELTVPFNAKLQPHDIIKKLFNRTLPKHQNLNCSS